MCVLEVLVALVIMYLIGIRDGCVLYIFILLIIVKYMLAEIVNSRNI